MLAVSHHIMYGLPYLLLHLTLSIPHGTNAIELLNHQCPSLSHISVLATSYVHVLRYQHITNAIEFLNLLCHSPFHTSMLLTTSYASVLVYQNGTNAIEFLNHQCPGLSHTSASDHTMGVY